MNKGKIVAFSLVSIVLIINTYLLYFFQESFRSVIGSEYTILGKALGTILAVIFVTIFVMIAFASKRRVVKKTLLRFSILITLALTIISIVARFMEGYASHNFTWRLVNTILYVVLFVLTMVISRDLYDTLNEQLEEAQ